MQSTKNPTLVNGKWTDDRLRYYRLMLWITVRICNEFETIIQQS